MLSYTEQLAIMQNVMTVFKSVVPIRTGNLKENAVKFSYKGDGIWVIEIDQSIAPYMPYTNEPWIAPKWHGKKNPNEHWFDVAAELIATLLAQELQGRLQRIGARK